MKTSWTDTQAIEQYLLGRGNPAERAGFEARMNQEPLLQESLHWQHATYHIVREYGRQKLRTEIEQVAQRVFTAPKYSPFRQRIIRLFSK